jgi:transposase
MENGLPLFMRNLAQQVLSHLLEMDKQVQEIDLQVRQLCRQSEVCRRLEQVPRVGPLTASALDATVGDNITSLKSGRQLAAFLTLMPGQHSSGGKQLLQGTSNSGDGHLRRLLVHGARGYCTTPCASQAWRIASCNNRQSDEI